MVSSGELFWFGLGFIILVAIPLLEWLLESIKDKRERIYPLE
jgi:hypothetical protein